MPLHLLKLSVGTTSIADLETHHRRRGPVPFHTTRVVPRRHPEIVGQGSIFWVIRGSLCCRQAVTGIEPFTDADGIERCRLMLDTRIVPVAPRPCRPFQGWRYLAPADAPADLDEAGAGLAEMPESLRRELMGLGLL